MFELIDILQIFVGRSPILKMDAEWSGDVHCEDETDHEGYGFGIAKAVANGLVPCNTLAKLANDEKLP